MKLWVLALALFFAVSSFADETVSAGIPMKPEQESLPGIVPFIEVFALNAFVWGWDRYVIDKDYAEVTPEIWQRNMREGWQWDDNHWGINFFGHPYQGTYYFVAARSAGFSFYPSFLFAALGSWEWELFAEREYPAPNDFITTSVGGALYGEILFRLSRRLLAKPDPTWFEQGASFVLHPLSYFHWKLDGERPNNPGYVPLSGSVTLGGGYRFGSDYRYDKNASDRLDNEWNEFFGFGAFEIAYGNPDRKVKEPLQQFSIYAHYEHGQEESFFNMNSSGKLYSFHKSDHEGTWTDVAFMLDFDSFYGDLVQMGNLALGLGLDIRIPMSDCIWLRYLSEPGFIFLGSADFNYDELLAEIDANYEVTRNYQYNYGAKYTTMFEVSLYHRFLVRERFNVNFMKTMPGTEPHYGAHGYDIVGVNELDAEAKITKRVNFGVRLYTYFKVAAYTGEYFEPMSRIMHSVGFYNKVDF